MAGMNSKNFKKVTEAYNPPADREGRRAYNKAYNAKLNATQPVGHTKLDDDQEDEDTLAKRTTGSIKRRVGS